MKWSVTICPTCNADSTVKDSRTRKIDGGAVRRRRECLNCKRRWTTLEVNIEEIASSPAKRKIKLHKVLKNISDVDQLIRAALGNEA